MNSVGVLALQGSVAEHIRSLSRIGGVEACEVKSISDLEKVSGLILPGGESTTIGKLLKDFGLLEPIVKRINEGMPVWGTCAGMILMAKKIVNENYIHLGVMDIAVKRNAYGAQLDSFSIKTDIPKISSKDFPVVFIRAPWVESVENGVEVLVSIHDKIVAVQQGHMLATSFHPELTEDLSFHKYFVGMIKQSCN